MQMKIGFKTTQHLVKALALAAFAAGIVPSAPAQQRSPVTLIARTPLPGIVGDFDFLALDLKRNHLFIAAEEHHTIEVFDAKTGKHLQSVSGVKTPHTLAYVADKDELFIADGGDYSCIILSGEDFHQVGRIALISGAVTGKTDSPDTDYYDSRKRIFYLGHGGKSANLPYSEIAAISVDSHKIVGRIRVEGNNLEGMAVDDAHDRLYVNIRDQKKIGVIDLRAMKVVDTWTAPDINRNTSLSFDAATNRVFVVGRSPGIFYAFDAATGKVVQQQPCVDIADSMTWDPQMKRVYITGSQGLSIFEQKDKDHYTELANLPTNGGKTAVYSAQLKQLYIVHPKTSIDDAGLLIYRVNR
jgi:DNA-binding beta-propeller fold protein YncE